MKGLLLFVSSRRKMTTVHPKSGDVFNAYKLCPYHRVCVVIIGQDPYHTPNTAHGLSFSSLGQTTPPSLMNVFKEIKRSLYPITPFETLFANNNLSYWAEQGVLLINRVMTVDEGTANSHKGKGWEEFNLATIKKLNERDPVVYMLWGKEAQKLKPEIDKKHLILEAAHPSPLAGDAFKYSDHFAQANKFLLGRYGKSIDWRVNPIKEVNKHYNKKQSTEQLILD